MIHVRVDFNSRGRDGLVRGSVRRASGPVEEGEKVIAADEDEDMIFLASVVQIEDSGRLWLEVDWDASRPSWASLDITNHDEVRLGGSFRAPGHMRAHTEVNRPRVVRTPVAH